MEKKKIEEVIASLEYDFCQFSLKDFIEHVAIRKRREIIVHEFPFQKAELSAVWIPAETAHYLLYNSRYHRIHQNHSILHELAHIILGHPCKDIREILSGENLEAYFHLCQQGRPRWIGQNLQDEPDEREAEFFVSVIQEHIIFAKRLDELTGKASSNESFNQFVRSAAYTA